MADKKDSCLVCKIIAFGTTIGICYYGSYIIRKHRKIGPGFILSGIGFIGFALLLQRELGLRVTNFNKTGRFRT